MKTKFAFTILLSLSICYLTDAQNFYENIQHLNRYKLDSLKGLDRLSASKRAYILAQSNLIKNGNVKQSPNVVNAILKNILNGDYYLFNPEPRDSLAFDFYSKALNLALENNDTLLIAEASKKILNKLHKSRHALESYPNYLNTYKNYLHNENEVVNYLFHKYNFQGSFKRINKIDSLLILFRKSQLINNPYLSGKIAQLIGNEYDFFEKRNDSALFYYEKARRLLESKPYKHFENELFGIYGNLGLVYQKKQDYATAQKLFLKADATEIPRYRYFEKEKINLVLSNNAKLQNNWQEAFNYLEKRNKYLDSLNEYKKAKQINEINIKYQTEKKEKQLLIEQQKRKQNRNLLYGAMGLIVFGGIIFFLIQKNTKRKQKLAEQEKEIESQKLATVLKEQELTAIDAMIEGQEKERQRIANDLHDDLGGLMANVKLHFNALKDKGTKELFDKTDDLLEEAYQKVRTVAHAKNSGVIAKQGLLKAVQNMAEKISVSNKITIDVLDHGLDQRLENSLELTLFRIIQELTTNVIKHAKANEVTIHMTNHEDSINIMVEDNGIGFNPKQITKTKSGMGISSIDKRIAHLDGTMTIESEKDKGTTVIIDIPL